MKTYGQLSAKIYQEVVIAAKTCSRFDTVSEDLLAVQHRSEDLLAVYLQFSAVVKISSPRLCLGFLFFRLHPGLLLRLTHSLTHSLIHSLTHSLTHSVSQLVVMDSGWLLVALVLVELVAPGRRGLASSPCSTCSSLAEGAGQ